MVEVKGKLKPDWSKATPARAHAYIYKERGLSRENADAFVENNRKAAASELEKRRGKRPEMGTDIDEFEVKTAEWQTKMDELQRRHDYWQAVKDEQRRVLEAEAMERAERDGVLHDEAVAAERADYEARKRAEAERRAVGNGNPMPAITEKWNNAAKIDGHRDEIMLPDGTSLKGHYVLHESGASSPSHNPETWQKTDGFPMDANGGSVNDRDYERDRDAQEHTRSIARQYDQRALQSVPVVSNDGVVLSGNGRTMAGELAARDNTDGAYVSYLREYAPKFGFTAEQVDGMQHPRVSFVPDEAMPYTAETFARFNQQEMKSQNKTEQAVKLGKTVGDGIFRRIVRAINGYDTLGDFYNDAEASLGAVYDLHSAGVIPQAQLAEMVDGVRGQEKLSAVGREFLENMLIGKAFESDPEVVRMLTAEPSMRRTVITALGEIVDNIALGGEWSLQGALADAVKLCFDARQGGARYGEIVSVFARQGVLFADPDELQTVADFNNATMLMLADVLNDKRVTLLKTTVQLYNDRARDAAAGQADLFAGGIESREDILRDVINFINENYGKRKEIEAARASAVERRKAESVQQNGIDGGRSSGSEVAGEDRRGTQSQEEPTVDIQENSGENAENQIPNGVQAALAAAERETVSGHDLQEPVDSLGALQGNGKSYDENAYDAYLAGRRFGNDVDEGVSVREAIDLAHKMVSENDARGGLYILPFLDGVGDGVDLRHGKHIEEAKKREAEYRSRKEAAGSGVAVAPQQAEAAEGGSTEASAEAPQEDGGARMKFTERAEGARDVELARRERMARAMAAEMEGIFGVPMRVITRPEDITNAQARRKVEEDRQKGTEDTKAWYDTATGEVCVYAPHVGNPRVAVRTYLHEVVGHKGLRGLFRTETDEDGRETNPGFDKLCDRVWEMMPEAQRKRFLNYPGVRSIADEQQRQRAAADEYMAHMAEEGDEWDVDRSVKERVVHWLKMHLNNVLEKLGFDAPLTDDDVRQLIKASARRLEREKRKAMKGAAEETAEAEGGGAMFMSTEGDNSQADAELLREGYSEPAPAVERRRLTPKEQRQRDAYEARRFRNLHTFVDKALDKLRIKDICDVYDSIDDVPGAQDMPSRRQHARGWYNPETGRITIVLRNHRNQEDVGLTILHEAVGHHGLRELFGERFDTFLDNVYGGAAPEIHSEINRMARERFEHANSQLDSAERQRRMYDATELRRHVRAATEEYLAGLAERTDFRADSSPYYTWWDQIKRWFVEMLHDIGLPNFFAMGDITDNELRYVLWRSYKNLTEPGHYRNPWREAEDVSMQYRLKTGEFAEPAEVETDGGIRLMSTEGDGGHTREEAMERRRMEKQRRDEVNHAIDSALSFVTGKDMRTLRQERRAEEAGRKKLAKELYGKILANEFDDVTLQLLNKYIDDVTPNNPYGRRLSERLPQAVERKLYAGKRTGCVDALVSRISEGSVGADERAGEAGRRAVEEKKKEILTAWAKATGHWHTDLSDFTHEKEPIGSGRDSDVYMSDDDGYVVKLSKGKPSGKRFRPDIDNIPLFNFVFPNSSYEILGYGDFGKGFVRILKQRAVDFHKSDPLSESERSEYMEGLGFHPINKGKTAFSNGDIIVSDLQKNNIVRDAGGNIRVIDADLKLHTRDVGGLWEYPPVESDMDGGAVTSNLSDIKDTDIPSNGQGNGGNNSMADGNGGGRANFMVSEERDAEYMDAVEKGDSEKAGRMVREAAKMAMPETKVVDENGEPRVVYHGTNLTRVNGSMPFWVFNEDSHFGTREQAGDAFGRSLRRKELSKIYSVYLDIRNPKRVDDVPEDWLKPHSEYWEPIIRQAKEEGYDGLVYSNTWEASEQGKDSYVAFYPEQVKSADPVTRDDRGNVIPLSERFNPEKDDIRFMSDGVDDGRTEEIMERAKKKFGLTDDVREAGYVLPDGGMLDFSGRNELDAGADDSFLRGSRQEDHRRINSIAYDYDADGNEVRTGVETDMRDFIRRGGIRIDAGGNVGIINLAVKPTEKQRAALRRLINLKGGNVDVDFGDGWNSDHYVEYDGAKAQRVLGDIDRYFDEGIKPEGNVRFMTDGGESLDEAVRRAEQEAETAPSDGQKEAGNYRKGHVRIDGFDISIEQARGSVRSGVDENGKKWSTKMNNTYGYIRGTKGADGDHVDVFLSDHLDNWNGMVFVVDQVKKDGSFDEHKVMYGFNDYDEARKAYFSNYGKGWQGFGDMNGITLDGFKKWLDSGDRKDKEFSKFAYPRVMTEKTLKDSKGNVINRNKAISSHDEAVDVIKAIQTEIAREFDARAPQIISEKSELDVFEKAGAQKEFVDEIRKIYDEPNTVAYYSHLLDEVFIFPNKFANLGANARVVKGKIYHESIHQVLFKNFSDEDVAATAALIRRYYPDIREYVEKDYKESSDRVKNEEVICTLVEKDAEKGMLGFLTNTSDFKIKELTRRIDDIVEFLKDRNYGKTRNQLSSSVRGRIGPMEERPSSNARGEEGTDTRRRRTLGESQSTHQGDAGEGGNLTGFSKTSEEDNQGGEVNAGPDQGDRVRFMTDEGGEAEDSEVRDESEGGEAEGSETEGGRTAEEEAAEAVAMEPVEPAEMSLKEQVLQGLMAAAERYRQSGTMRTAAVKEISAYVSSLQNAWRKRKGLNKEALEQTIGAKVRRGMSWQKAEDQALVEQTVRLAKLMLQGNFAKGLTPGEVKRLMGYIQTAVGRPTDAGEGRRNAGTQDPVAAAKSIVDLLALNQLRTMKGMVSKMMQVKTSKVNSQGVEVQAGLDLKGQVVVKAMREALQLSEDDLGAMVGELRDAMGSDDPITAENAALRWQGYMLAVEYNNQVRDSESEEKQLFRELRAAEQVRYPNRKRPVRKDGSVGVVVSDEDSHFGTREQAENAFGRSLRRMELSKIYSVYLDIRNPKSTSDKSRIPRMPMRRTLLNIW